MKTALAFLLLVTVARAQHLTANIPYAESAPERQVLDIYAPDGAKNLPVVFWIHGGGWQTGDKSDVQIKPQVFADRGFVFVSTNYRLLPQVEMEVLIRDVARSLGWVHKNIAKHGGDPSRIFVMGHSAGAQLAALICIDDRYLKAEGVPLGVLKGCVPVDGDTYDIPAIIVTAELRQTVHGLPLPQFGHRVKFGNDPKKHIDFSAVTHVAKGKGIPPFLILHVAGHPDVTAQARRLGAVLKAADIPVVVFGAQETTHSKLNADLGLPDDPATRELFKFLDPLVRVSAARASADDEANNASPQPPPGAIAFSSLAPRGWDVYVADLQSGQTRRLTDHAALDYNAAFTPDGGRITFVSERDGNLELYAIALDGSGLTRVTSEFALDDHPAWSPNGRQLAFASTRQASAQAGRAWNANYVMQADGSGVRRLTPSDAADYSPAWSLRGDLIAFATGSGRAGGTDIGVMKPDGSGRRELVKDGGWPTFAADGQSVFFHSRRDGAWGIWKVQLDGSGLKRVTPNQIEAYTPRACTDGKRLVLAVKRGALRQIELFDLETGKLSAVTSDNTDHWNPSISNDGRYVVFHQATEGAATPNVELWGSPPGTDLLMLRLAGAFPAFAPNGKRLALTGGRFATVDVMDVDGLERKTIYSGGKARNIFGIYWAHHGDWISFAHGGVFQAPGAAVNVSLIHPDGSGHHTITEDAGNNGFPAFSPDGKQIVFRSGRGGSKNLFIMDRDGGNLRQLTRGEWTDTMCDWSPTGEWIAFASNRDGDFEIWLIKPDGSGLRKLIGSGGRNNHPHFSPDGRWLVFTSQRAGLSAEEVSLPDQPQPYGDLFAVGLDGVGLVRLTHNGFEEGTPAWGPKPAIKPSKNGRSETVSDY